MSIDWLKIILYEAIALLFYPMQGKTRLKFNQRILEALQKTCNVNALHLWSIMQPMPMGYTIRKPESDFHRPVNVSKVWSAGIVLDAIHSRRAQPVHRAYV